MRGDVPFSIIKKVFVALVVLVAVIQLSVWWLYRYFRTQDQRRDVSPTFVNAAPPVPPEPRLQVNAQADYQEYLRQQKAVLNSYSWVSRADGVVRIPVDRAMELVVERERK